MYLDDDLATFPWVSRINRDLEAYRIEQFVSGDIVIKLVSEDWERQQYYRLREATFRDEQQLLQEDRDEHDFKALGIVAICQMFGEPDQVVGAVRIFPDGAMTWWGGRLCVDPLYRHHRCIGKALINAAVSTAKRLGCQTFLATVQQQNERYFQKLYWESCKAMDVTQIPHVLMRAQLVHYPLRNISQAYMQHACQEVHHDTC